MIDRSDHFLSYRVNDPAQQRLVSPSPALVDLPQIGSEHRENGKRIEHYRNFKLRWFEQSQKGGFVFLQTCLASFCSKPAGLRTQTGSS